MKNKEILIKSINEYMGFTYMPAGDEGTLNSIVTTRDTIEGFIECQDHIKSESTQFGQLEVFNSGNFELWVMDFGDHRLALLDS